MSLVVALALATQTAPAVAASDAASEQVLRDFKVYCGRAAQLWGRSLCGPVVIVEPKTRRAVTNVAPPDPKFRRNGDVWVGTLPADLALANTSIHWGGKRWAEVLLPLPNETAERRILLAHEAFHRIQLDIGFKPREADNGHLDSKDGRIYARLEVAALKAALTAARAGREWRSAARDALAYRDARVAAFPMAAEAEAALLGNEGLAEYTGILVAVPGERTRAALSQLDSANERASLIRSFGYVVGPAYGLLLDRSTVPWRRAAVTGKPLPDMLRDALGAPARPKADLTAYGAPGIVAAENARAEQIRERTDALTASLVTGPRVTFPFEKMQIEFDPNSLFALGQEGTVYSGATTIRDTWGELKVSGDVLIGPKWNFGGVPGPATQEGNTIKGPGWSAMLAPGYKLTAGKRTSEQLVSEER